MNTESPSELQPLAPVKKPESVRELGAVDLTEIRPMILNLPESLWDIEDTRKENQFPCFHHTRHIVFRFVEGNRDPRVFYSRPIWSVWQSKLEPIFNDIVKPYGFTNPVYPKVMLARLAARAVIDRHVDGAGSNLCTHKIHVPIKTNPGAILESNDIKHHLVPGFAYEVNNIAPHGVRNDGDEDRIHLIFEVFEGDA